METTNIEYRDAEMRDDLARQHLGLVRHIGRKIERQAPGAIEFDDLVSAGSLGLLQAIDGFDANRHHAFSTYAAPRIRGAMLDELRRQDIAPRLVRRRQRALRTAQNELVSENSRPPSHVEVADRLNVSTEELWDWKAALERAVHISFDRSDDGDGSAAFPSARVPGRDDATESMLERAQKVDVVQQAIMELPDQEKLVLTLYYHEELTLREIADVIGVTESRISQIRTAALARLRGALVEVPGRNGPVETLTEWTTRHNRRHASAQA